MESRRPTPSPAGRCDLCGDRERLELARLPDGRFACVVCRYDLERRAKARAELARPPSRPRSLKASARDAHAPGCQQ